MRAAPGPIRFTIAALLALLLALRTLAPAGFMPAFDHGAVTIVVCPDAVPAMAGMHHHSPDHNFARHPCPYASAASLGALGPEWAPLLILPFFAAVLLLGRTFLFVERQTARERPPSRGPPIPV